MISNSAVRSALAAGKDAEQAVQAAALDLVSQGTGGTLGFIYTTDSFNARLPEIADRLRAVTGVGDWVGTVGFGVIAGRRAVFDAPALALMIVDWPNEQYQFFQGVPPKAWQPPRSGPFGSASAALVHADPSNPRYPELLQSLSRVSGAYLAGGVTASRSGYSGQIAGIAAEGGISGVLTGPGIAISVGISQGCTACGPVRTITAGERNLILELDGMPALDSLLLDLKIAEANDIDALYTALETLHVSLMVPNCDTGDYLVRNLMGIDTENGIIAIGDRAETGGRMFFSRRDRAAATDDLKAMARKARSRVNAVNGALYISCCGRGPYMFGSAEEEIGYVQDVLGDVPLAGFYANGEIAGERVYGFTGVLTLF